MHTDPNDWIAVRPVLILILTGLAVAGWDVFLPRDGSRRGPTFLAFGGVVLSLITVSAHVGMGMDLDPDKIDSEQELRF